MCQYVYANLGIFLRKVRGWKYALSGSQNHFTAVISCMQPRGSGLLPSAHKIKAWNLLCKTFRLDLWSTLNWSWFKSTLALCTCANLLEFCVSDFSSKCENYFCLHIWRFANFCKFSWLVLCDLFYTFFSWCLQILLWFFTVRLTSADILTQCSGQSCLHVCPHFQWACTSQVCIFTVCLPTHAPANLCVFLCCLIYQSHFA